ncbi:MAG: fimbrillin family protein [Tannerella sp.]|nr:fimbrillin family protein [Tannerella sp.]
MKKYIVFSSNVILMMAVTFIFLNSCSDSVIKKETLISDFKNPAFSVKEDAVTYTSLGSDLKILWQEGDKIGIFCDDTNPPTFNERAILHQAYIGQNRGVFVSDIDWGTSSHKFFVYYPWKENVGMAPELNHAIQRVQAQNGNNSMHIGKNAFMFSRVSDVVPSSGDIPLDFTHTTSIFEISFKSDHPSVYGKPLTKVVLKASNGATLSGDFIFNITKVYNASNMPQFSNECDSVILNVENAYMPDNSTDSLRAYLVVNPAYMDKAIITYTVGGEEYTLVKNVDRQLKAQSVYKIMTKVEYSALSVTPQILYLSPANPSGTITVKSTHPWVFNGAACAVATSLHNGGESGEVPFLLTRKTSLVDFTVYGSSTAEIRTTGDNTKSASVRIENLYLSVPETLYISNPSGADTTIFMPDIVAFGGSARYVVDGYTGDWIQSVEYHEISGKLRIKVLHNNTNADRPGTLTVHHIDDPSYQLTIPLLQNEFKYVPEFKFFVMDIQWCKRTSLDVDIAFLFENNNPITPMEDLPVGYGALYSDPNLRNKPANASQIIGSTSSNTYVNYIIKTVPERRDTVKLLNWGGDAVDGQGETVYFDAEAFHDATDVPRYLNLGLYLTWWKHGHANEHWTVRVTLSCYRGGTMVKYASIPNRTATNYRNVGGELVHSQSFFIELNHVIVQVPSSFKTKFTYAAAITYDRITHYGIMRETDPARPKWSADKPLCENDTDVNTSSTPISAEDIKRIEDAKKKAASQIF